MQRPLLPSPPLSLITLLPWRIALRTFPALLQTLALLTLMLLPAPVAASDHVPVFQKLPLQEQIHGIEIFAYAQDDDGYIWFITDGALHRYDGSRLLTFRHRAGQPDSLGPGMPVTLAMVNNTPWVGLYNGELNELVDRQHFRRYPLPEQAGLGRAWVHRIAWDGDQHLWLATSQGAMRFHLPSRQFTRITLDSSSQRIRTLSADLPRKRVLFSDQDGRVYSASSAQPEPQLLLQLPGTQRAMNALWQDGLWVLTREALFVQRDANQPLEQTPLPASLRDATRLSLRVSRHGHAWISSAEHGLFLKAAGETRWQHYPPDHNPGTGVGDRTIYEVFIDARDQIWLATYPIQIAALPINGLRRQLFSDSGVGRNDFCQFARQPDGRLLIAVCEGGLLRISADGREVENLTPQIQIARGRPADERLDVRAVAIQGNDIWLAGAHGLFRWNGAQNIRHYTLPPTHPGAQEQALKLYAGASGTLWAAAYAGVFSLAPGAEEFHSWGELDSGRGKLRNAVVNAVLETGDNEVWLATEGYGLCRLHVQHAQLKCGGNRESDAHSLGSDVGHDLLRDANQQIWIAHAAGLSRLRDASAEHWQFDNFYGSALGFLDDRLYSVNADAEGALWLGGHRGLVRFDPQQTRAQTFRLGEGMPDLPYNIAASLRLDDGEVLLGNRTGLVRVPPRQRGHAAASPLPLHFTALSINGRASALPAAGTTLNLAHDARHWRVQFSLLDFAGSGHRRYRHRLLGFEQQWHDSEFNGEATYTNLPPGHYRLEVEALGNDGQPRASLSLPLHLAESPWRTTAAYTLYAVTALGLLSFAGWRRWRILRERREHFRALRASEARLKAALSGAGDAVWEMHLGDGSTQRLGLENLGIAGLDNAISDSAFRACIHDADREPALAERERHLRGETDQYVAEYRLRSGDDWIWVEDRGRFTERDRHGAPLRLLGTLKNISARKQAEAEILHANERLEQRISERTRELATLNKELEMFAFSVSHDLRAPLRAILGFTDLLAETALEKLDDEEQALFRRILTNARRMQHLTDDFLKLAYVSRAALDVRPLALADICRSIFEQKMAAQPQLVTTLDLAELAPMHGDADLINVVLENLIGNAIKYSAKVSAPRVEIRSFCESGETVLMIGDNGAGFDPAQATRLFEPFQRLHSSSEFEGSGVGLSTVKRIIERHGGRIWFDAAPGAGARFYFTLAPAEKPVG